MYGLPSLLAIQRSQQESQIDAEIDEGLLHRRQEVYPEESFRRQLPIKFWPLQPRLVRPVSEEYPCSKHIKTVTTAIRLVKRIRLFKLSVSAFVTLWSKYAKMCVSQLPQAVRIGWKAGRQSGGIESAQGWNRAANQQEPRRILSSAFTLHIARQAQIFRAGKVRQQSRKQIYRARRSQHFLFPIVLDKILFRR